MRTLATVCAAFSVGVFLSHYLLPSAWLFPAALILALCGIALILLRRRWLLPVVLSFCAFAAGLYCYGMHDMLIGETARLLDDRIMSASLRVLTAPVKEQGYTRAEILLQTEEGRELRGLLYDRSGMLAVAEPGDDMEGWFRFRRADVRSGEEYDGDYAKGIYFRANNVGDLTRKEGGRASLRAYASLLSRRIAERVGTMFPEDLSPFFRALMLGDKSGLYADDELELSLSRAGLMHMVAVSGMHIAFLVGMLRQLMGNTRRASLLMILLIWAFVLLTGSSPSAVRAGLMQTLVLLAPVFGREDDPPTSLFFALALILLLNPFAAGSVSLQLSFSALAGIMLFSDRIRIPLMERLPEFLPHWLRNYLSSTVANSFSVLAFTVPLTALWFGSVAVLSPLANLLVLWAVPFCFGLGWFACLVSLLSLGAASVLILPAVWLGRYVLMIARRIASIDFACLYTTLRLNAVWLVLVYVLVIEAALLFRQRWKRWFYPSALAALSLFALLLGTRLYYGDPAGTLSVLDVGQGQSIVVMAGESTAVIDCGNIYGTDDAGDLTGQYLRSRQRTRIDLLFLTHLHADHADGVLRLMEYLPVERIVAGDDLEDPNQLLPQILASAEKHGTEVMIVREDLLVRCGDVEMQVFAPGRSGDANERCLSLMAGVGGTDFLVTGDMDMAAERELLREHALSGVEYLIVGHHGSRYSSSEELLRGIGADKAVVSVGYNPYGHPTEEVLERLALCGYTVYRTDLDGTLEFRFSRG